MDEFGLMTPLQVAQELGYHVNHIYRLIRQGHIQAVKFGRSWGITEAEVERVKRLREEKGRFWYE